MQLNISYRRSLAAALSITALLGVAHAAAADAVRFGGDVERGETYVHRFTHNGAAYEFRLAPVSHGWQIRIGDPARPDLDFLAVATPPFRGINPSRIEGWHFRNADNTGSNKAGPKNVNAPQAERRFAFTTDEAGRRAAADALDILLWPGQRQAPDVEAAERRFRQTAKIGGSLLIEALELGNLAAGERAWIERMAFSVSIGPPN